jgi:DHA1 family bicyclomycin/chloramphenicol resistance-like MFS transporter
MSLLMLVFSISPLLAPLVGSGVIAAAGWRAVFWVVAVAAVAGLVLVFHGLQETRTAADRRESSLASALSGYWLLLRDRHYLGLVFIGGCSIAGFFVYLASSPFVLINHYGLTPVQYSLAFSVNAAAFFAAAQFTAYLGRRFGLVPTVKVAVTGAGAVMVTMLSYYLAGGDRLAVLLGLYFVASGLMGLVIPSTSVLALEEHGAIAGTASALLGTLQMLIGAAAMGLVGLFSNGKPLPMVVGMASGALMGLALTWITLGRHRVAGSPDNQSVL